MHRALSIFLVLVAVATCGGSDNGNVNNAGNQPPASAAAVAQGVAVGAGLTVALAAPLSSTSGDLHDGGKDMPEGDVHTKIEDGVSGSSVVEPATCASYDWSKLSVDVTLTDCTLEATGEPIDGGLSIAVSFDPTTVAVGFVNLVVGANTVDGGVEIAVTGADKTKASTAITGSVDYSGEKGAATVEVNLTSVAGQGGELVVDGTGTVKSATLDTTFKLDAVTWKSGECLPSSGSVSYVDGVAIVITFLPATPTDGVVQVKVGNLPATEQALLTPCGEQTS